MNNYYNKPSFNYDQFVKMVPNLTEEMLIKLARQARANGIPEETIKAGLEYIYSINASKK